MVLRSLPADERSPAQVAAAMAQGALSRGALTRIDRLRYRARHKSLAALLGAYMELWHTIYKPARRPDLRALEALRADMEEVLAADLRNVEVGHYPRALLFSFPFRDYLRTLPEALLDQPRIYWRARRGRFDDLPDIARPGAYPAYYRRNFHWQTDGWLSARSARLYDLSVELLFGGLADVMRRMALPPLLQGARRVPRPRVLDIGCGTGRFLAMVERALPAGRFVGVDMSPYYVAHARKMVPRGADIWFRAENAESLSLSDRSFDAASSVYLFHELPGDVRRRVAGEAFRVLRPGARFVVCDAAQRSDCGALRGFFERFPEVYHEPYFKGYLGDDLEPLLAGCGFQIESSQRYLFSKVVVARRPAAEPWLRPAS